MDDVEGDFPEIEITKYASIFEYTCKRTGRYLGISCREFSSINGIEPDSKCYSCVGWDSTMRLLYKMHGRCKCGTHVEFGYFLIIYMLTEADLLPKDFIMKCCACAKEVRNEPEKD
jgi:hypothetical protein